MRVVFVGRSRAAWKEVLLAILTLGISRRVWLYRINREIDGHDALGLRHPVNAALLALPVLGPSIVTLQTARRTARMLSGSPVRYGPPGWVWAASFLPLVGTILFFIPWQQGRLNRFWSHERGQAGRGIEVDLELGTDPRFLVEMGRALRESYHAGSRFDARKRARRASWGVRLARWRAVQAERRRVRDAGGTTPLFPWAAPRRPAARLLHVTCGACQTRFDVRRDPAADTPLLCPRCGRADVLPSLHSDPLRGTVAAAVPDLHVRCPRCSTRFHAVHNLHGPTELRCPECGATDTLPAPAQAPQPRRKAERPESTSA